MTNESRLRDVEDAERVTRLLSEAVADLDRPWSAQAQARVGLQLADRLQQAPAPSHFMRWAVAVALVAAIATVALVPKISRHAAVGPGTISLGTDGTLQVSSNGAVDLPPVTPGHLGRRIVLKSGQVCAEIAHRDVPRQGPLVVEAPQLEVVVIGTQFCVTTANGVSSVSVTRGRVRAESPTGGAVPVSAGESIRSDDKRLAAPAHAASTLAPALAPAAGLAPLPPTPACGDAVAIDARRACYDRVALGHDIAAQNALYGLGFLERDEARNGPAALAAWQRYEERFPAGVYAPEASLAVLGELLQEKRYPEALRETDRYLATDEESGKDRVELVRAQLLLGPMSQAEQALPLLRRLVESGDPSLREEALFSLGVCLQSLGRQDEAAAAFRRSLAEYPAGTHAAEIRSLAP